MYFPQEPRKTRKVAQDAVLPTKSYGSAMQDPEHAVGSSRDALAETFVVSFLRLQHEVPTAVQRGLSVSFDLDAYLRACQAKVDALTRNLQVTTDPLARDELISRMNVLLDDMCSAQAHANEKWVHVEEQITSAVNETESHWKRAETFFRSKQKRGDNRATLPGELRGKNRKAVSTNVGDQGRVAIPAAPMRATMLPKANPVGVARKAKAAAAVVDIVKQPDMRFSLNSSRPRSVTPERTKRERQSKLTPKQVHDKRAELKHNRESKDKERIKLKAPPLVKKRRPRQKRVVRDHHSSEEASRSEDSSKDSSDPPYRAPSEIAKNTGHSSGGDGDDNRRSGSARGGRQDPDEPRYCICRNISFGHMVCCDNEECVMEWFHFVCVGLKTKPRGKWYCPSCRDGDNCKLVRNRPAAEFVREPVDEV